MIRKFEWLGSKGGSYFCYSPYPYNFVTPHCLATFKLGNAMDIELVVNFSLWSIEVKAHDHHPKTFRVAIYINKSKWRILVKQVKGKMFSWICWMSPSIWATQILSFASKCALVSYGNITWLKLHPMCRNVWKSSRLTGFRHVIPTR